MYIVYIRYHIYMYIETQAYVVIMLTESKFEEKNHCYVQHLK